MREQDDPEMGRLDRELQEPLAEEDGHHGTGLKGKKKTQRGLEKGTREDY